MNNVIGEPPGELCIIFGTQKKTDKNHARLDQATFTFVQDILIFSLCNGCSPWFLPWLLGSALWPSKLQGTGTSANRRACCFANDIWTYVLHSKGCGFNHPAKTNVMSKKISQKRACVFQIRRCRSASSCMLFVLFYFASPPQLCSHHTLNFGLETSRMLFRMLKFWNVFWLICKYIIIINYII